jgi:hypothetical protein
MRNNSDIDQWVWGSRENNIPFLATGAMAVSIFNIGIYPIQKIAAIRMFDPYKYPNYRSVIRKMWHEGKFVEFYRGYRNYNIYSIANFFLLDAFLLFGKIQYKRI